VGAGVKEVTSFLPWESRGYTPRKFCNSAFKILQLGAFSYHSNGLQEFSKGSHDKPSLLIYEVEKVLILHVSKYLQNRNTK
jgi:hypothetical protein